MAVAAGGGWMRFKCASHFPSTEHAVWFRKESFCTLASFTRRFNPPNSTWDRGRIEKEGEEQGLRDRLLLRAVPGGSHRTRPRGGSRLPSGCQWETGTSRFDREGRGGFYMSRGCEQFWRTTSTEPTLPGGRVPRLGRSLRWARGVRPQRPDAQWVCRWHPGSDPTALRIPPPGFGIRLPPTAGPRRRVPRWLGVTLQLISLHAIYHLWTRL